MARSVFGKLFSGTRPDYLGQCRSTLAPCPALSNCVSSTAGEQRHAIAPLAFTGQPDTAMQTLHTVVTSMPRTRVIVHEGDYLYVECASKLLGFVDDVEFLLDRPARQIQVRSASRLGYSDLGVNRQRIESIRVAFQARQP
ncbi:MAG: DUF1499 domain-containing protein [Candidatus Tectomicrobia bacterium]|uniref:DUF1499 domain-containing protein n=1 Tax=Tectimicrobiota bacterium TaxID=2528274 RepID=A0A938B4D8_UNCTE|nr:DUF1499 domain-containing protein [Candidatus Tectomicrobia bacterium]